MDGARKRDADTAASVPISGKGAGRSWLPGSLSLFPAALLFAYGSLRYAGYLKDDAYISLRYAKHLAEGRGFVFNLSDAPVEGFTNFLWVVAESVGFLLGVGGADLAIGLSILSSVLALVYTHRLASSMLGNRGGLFSSAAVAMVAVQPMFLLWSQGGLAAPFLAAAFVGALYHLHELNNSESTKQQEVHLCSAISWVLLAALTRPEGHLLWIAAFLYLLGSGFLRASPTGDQASRGISKPRKANQKEAWDLSYLASATVFLAVLLVASLVRGQAGEVTRTVSKALPSAAFLLTLWGVFWYASRIVFRLLGRMERGRWLLSFLGITAPVLLSYHGWRLWYFEQLLPNTSFVKTAGGSALIGAGLRALWSASLVGAIWLLALVALGSVRWWYKRAICWMLASLILCFSLYLVLVGGDEMVYERLVLPALPLLAVLALHGAGALLSNRSQGVQWGVVLCFGAGIVISSVVEVEMSAPAFSDTKGGLARAHEAMAHYLRSRSQPGDAVIFQDMGAAPFVADDLRWLDPIGLTDPTVARARADFGVNPFVRGPVKGSRALEIVSFRKTVRNYLLAQNPRWIAFVVYLKRADEADEMKRAVPNTMREGGWSTLAPLLEDRLRKAPHYHSLFDDPRFVREFRFVALWRRKANYYLVLFERSHG